MGLEDLRQRLKQKSVSKIDWQPKLQRINDISQYLPAVLKWHGLHPCDLSIDKYHYYGLTQDAVRRCIDQIYWLGLLDNDYKIIDQYRPVLIDIANCAYKVLSRQTRSLSPNAVSFYMFPNDRFKVVYDPKWYIYSRENKHSVIEYQPEISKVIPAIVYAMSDYSNLVQTKTESHAGLVNTSLSSGHNSVVTPEISEIPSWEEVQNMTGIQFERYCMKLLELYGFVDVRGTEVTGDSGVDILCKEGTTGERYAIQCKRWAKSLGNKVVQEIYTGAALKSITFHQPVRAAVMTNSYFTQDAQKAAHKLGVILWDAEDVQKMAYGRVLFALGKKKRVKLRAANSLVPLDGIMKQVC